MSFDKMKRDELYTMAVDNFAVDVDETATKAQIIAALAENGVTWDMAKTFDMNARAVAEEEAPAGVITSAQTRPEPEVLIDPPVLEVEVDPVDDPEWIAEPTEVNFIEVPKGVDGYVRNNVFYPGEPEPELTVTTQAPAPVESEVVLVKMERDNPIYEIRGYRFTQNSPFALVKNNDADYILSHNDGFKIASPGEVKEFYG